MAGTQAPKGFGLMFVVVGIPLIIWSASGTNEKLAALDTTEAREAQCIAKTSHLSSPSGDAREMCHCIVSEADKRGITHRYGGYDKDALRPVIDHCFEAQVQQ